MAERHGQRSEPTAADTSQDNRPTESLKAKQDERQVSFSQPPIGGAFTEQKEKRCVDVGQSEKYEVLKAGTGGQEKLAQATLSDGEKSPAVDCHDWKESTLKMERAMERAMHEHSIAVAQPPQKLVEYYENELQKQKQDYENKLQKQKQYYENELQKQKQDYENELQKQKQYYEYELSLAQDTEEMLQKEIKDQQHQITRESHLRDFDNVPGDPDSGLSSSQPAI